MCSCNGQRTDFPPWRESLQVFVWRYRDQLRAALGLAAAAVTLAVLAALAGLVVYSFTPTDIERAEADVRKARAVVVALEWEAGSCSKDAEGHKLYAAEHQKRADEPPYKEWLEWERSMAYGHAELARAKFDRRDTLARLCATYLRLLAEAEGEILRAKDARDRGTPYKVAPRVRDLLAPVLAAR